MGQKKLWATAGKVLAAAAMILIVVLMFAPGVWAGEFKILHQFTMPFKQEDGDALYGRLIFDAAGNLYGTTAFGWGSGCNFHGCGGVFKLTPNPDGTWVEDHLSGDFFNVDAGAWPMAGLVFDSAGNLYGTAAGDPVYACCGRVFQGVPNPDGTWTWSTLYAFEGSPDGASPYGELVLDQAGNLYGTTTYGGTQGSYCWWSLPNQEAFGCGVVFKLTPNSGGSWAETVIYTFSGGPDGAWPRARLIFDSSGNLYGTTVAGGNYGGCTVDGCGNGVVFRLAPNSDGSWTETVLHSFVGGGGAPPPYASPDGANPYAGLIFDVAGNLYGTTANGGSYGGGVVFELMPNPDGSWVEKVLHQFRGGADGANPYADVVFDRDGDLWGTTLNGGKSSVGTVFKLAPGRDGRWVENAYCFTGAPARNPYAGLILDAEGNFYGTTAGGKDTHFPCGYHKACGVVFEIIP